MQKIYFAFIALTFAVTPNAGISAGIINTPGYFPFDSTSILQYDLRDISFKMKISKNNPGDSTPYALVAGGSKGIGYALAEALASRGYNLY